MGNDSTASLARQEIGGRYAQDLRESLGRRDPRSTKLDYRTVFLATASNLDVFGWRIQMRQTTRARARPKVGRECYRRRGQA